MVDLFNEIAGNPDCRVVLLSGAGRMFTAGGYRARSLSAAPSLSGRSVYSPCLCRHPGIDLADMASDVLQPQGDDTARVSWNLKRKIAAYQDTFSVIERVRTLMLHPEPCSVFSKLTDSPPE